GQADEEYQSDFIGGFLPIIHSYGYDAAVFSMLYKYQETYEQEQGDFSVFKLIPYDTIDGIVVLCDTIQTSGGINNLMKEIKEHYKGPVLCIDGNFDYPTQYSKSSKSIHALVKHLVNEHGYTDIAFLNGRKEHPFSKERFWDYMSGLKEVGIDYEEKRVFYGDFWYSSGENMVKNLLRSKEILPQAILCANDCMAIGVCKALESRGYKIPRDVAVVSYDCTEEGRQSPVPVTSAYIQADHTGRLAASNINRLVYGKNIIQDEPEPKLFVGESCGCHNERSRFADIRRKIWDTQKSRLGFESPYNNMMDDLLEQETPFDYINTVYSYLHQLGEYNRFFLCLNDDMISGKSAGRCKEFSERITAVIDSGSETKTDNVGFKESFPRSELLPEDAWDKEKTQTFFFTPICHKTDLFGYAAISYKNPDLSYDGIYRMWIKLVSRSMDLLRRNEMYRASEGKQVTSAAAVTETTAVSYEDEIMTEAVSEILDNNLFSYYFQPIVSAEDGSIYAYEALMRSKTEKMIPPLTIIKYAEKMGRLGDVEKATFVNVFRIIEENKETFGDAKVFINSIPGVKLEADVFDDEVRILKQNPDRVVIELTEKNELDDSDLNELKENYIYNGVEMAVDDYGTGYSNVANLLRYMPKYVKIDRMLLSGIKDNPQKQHFVREIVEFSHENGIVALAEGVETAEELETVVKLGVDLIQGFYTAYPQANIVKEIDRSVIKEILRYRMEKEDGADKEIYVAGKTHRVSLINLAKEGVTTIRVGEPGATHRDITIVGAPGHVSDIHLEVEDNYRGQIVLENAGLSNIKGRPAIAIGDGSDVTLVLKGENTLKGGILVNETAVLCFEGEGNISLNVGGNTYYGIGHDTEHHHGKLVFKQDGTVKIQSNGKTGVNIGSGLGGRIEIERGKYELFQSGDYAVNIGCLSGDASVTIDSCDLSLENTGTECVCVGSLSGAAEVSIKKTGFRVEACGIKVSVCGSLSDRNTKFRLENGDIQATILGPKEGCIIGSLKGSSDIKMNHGRLAFTANGENVYVFGGFTDKTDVTLEHISLKAVLDTDSNEISMVSKESMNIVGGAWHVYTNAGEGSVANV
nr:EAL domain-containing protein [Lachnospiraceae bacterium]